MRESASRAKVITLKHKEQDDVTRSNQAGSLRGEGWRQADTCVHMLTCDPAYMFLPLLNWAAVPKECRAHSCINKSEKLARCAGSSRQKTVACTRLHYRAAVGWACVGGVGGVEGRGRGRGEGGGGGEGVEEEKEEKEGRARLLVRIQDSTP